MENVLIIGCGDIGKRVAGLVMANAVVSALVRSEEIGKKLAEIGIRPLTGDLDNPASLGNLPTRAAVVFYFAPPPGGGHIDPRMRSFCASVLPGGGGFLR